MAIGLVAAYSGDKTCNSVDWACIVKSRPTALSLNYQWVLDFVKVRDVAFWVFGMFRVGLGFKSSLGQGLGLV